MSSVAVFIIARVLVSALLFWALARHAIGYYTILRFVTCAVCLYGAYRATQSKQSGWMLTFGAIAVLFNPIISFRMTRETWAYVDVLVAIYLLVSLVLFKPKLRDA
jgi:uncharacterized protein DUF6804